MIQCSLLIVGGSISQPFDIYWVKFYFSLMVDAFGSQILYWACYHFVEGVPLPFYHSLFETRYNLNIMEDQNPHMFFTIFEYPLPFWKEKKGIMKGNDMKYVWKWAWKVLCVVYRLLCLKAHLITMYFQIRLKNRYLA